MSKKVLFLDRDGTLIDEPFDNQVDSLSKIKFKKNVIPALLNLQVAGYILVMVTNQNGIGTEFFKREDFEVTHNFLMDIFTSQGVNFQEVLICPHLPEDECDCRKPKIGLVLNYLRSDQIDFDRSYVIGDRQTDMELAKNMGIKSIFYDGSRDWLDIANDLINAPRTSKVRRTTSETDLDVKINLDQNQKVKINTGIGFFDHMLAQLASHGGFGFELNVIRGDFGVDEHHLVEDVAIVLGMTLRQALGDKLGIERYGFLLPMDESLAKIAIDLSGRGGLVFDAKFTREKVGEFPTELVEHFFRSFAENLGATIHIEVSGKDNHHMIESIFKGVGRSLKQAIFRCGHAVPSTKGVL